MSEHRFRELDQAWERSQAYEPGPTKAQAPGIMRYCIEAARKDNPKLLWWAVVPRFAKFYPDMDIKEASALFEEILAVEQAQAQVLARAEELEAAIKKATE